MAALPRDWFDSRQGRVLLENLTAYLFIFPAGAIIFIFGLFPVAFAFFVSLYRWRRFPDEYLGLENYYKALGNFGYILFFFTALAVLVYAAILFYQLVKRVRGGMWLYILPGIVNAAAAALFVDWFFKLLPYVLDVPRRMPRGQTRDRALFVDEFFNSFKFEGVPDAGYRLLFGLVAGVVLSLACLWLVRSRDRVEVLLRITVTVLLVIGGAWLMRLTLNEMDETIQLAEDAGESLPIWTQIIFIGLGAILLFVAYAVWTRAVRQDEDRRFVFWGLAALLLMAGGYLLIVYFPQSITAIDNDLEQGFWVTILYVIGTVPVQLGLGLGLAYLLFHTQRGKTMFRIIYFLPYITPFAATAVVFSTMFSNRNNSPANYMLKFFGIDSQKWLLEPTPVNELIFKRDLPQLLEGPGLALVVIMIWSIWTYIGYDTVIFMAGLGNIPPEYYEAARIDGASTWSLFRHITLPLLSPTTFFLSLIAIIGTFQAFTQMWIMRRPAAYDAVDTVGVYLFETVSTKAEYGYGSAMAFVLFATILMITFFQNRILSRRVFYG